MVKNDRAGHDKAAQEFFRGWAVWGGSVPEAMPEAMK